MTSPPPRVVFDCNLFVQMMLNPGGTAGACQKLVENGKVTLFVSSAILAEVAEVLSRSRFKARTLFVGSRLSSISFLGGLPLNKSTVLFSIFRILKYENCCKSNRTTLSFKRETL